MKWNCFWEWNIAHVPHFNQFNSIAQIQKNNLNFWTIYLQKKLDNNMQILWSCGFTKLGLRKTTFNKKMYNLNFFTYSMGINWEQNGMTLRLAPMDEYCSSTSGLTWPLVLQDLYLNTLTYKICNFYMKFCFYLVHKVHFLYQ